MILQNIINQLASATEFKQVTEAGSASTTPQIDTEALLTTVLSAVTTDVYSLKLPENPSYPNIVYMLVGGKNQYFEKHLLTQVDTFIVSLREKELQNLAVKSKELLTSLVDSNYAIEILDKQKDHEAERDCYRLDLEISFSVPATGVNAETPALLVYCVGQNGEQSDYDNVIKQKVNSAYGIAILTAGNDVVELQTVVRNKLLGFQQTPQHFEIQFARGSPLESEGGLRIWREIYQDSSMIKQIS
jgi:hypothetical protein